MHNLIFASKNSLHLLVSYLFILSLPTIPIQSQEITFLSCPPVNSSNNYTSGSQFETNLKTLLLPSLISNGSLYGFFNTSSGNDPNSTVYGLVQCRGDISMDDCRTCLNISSVRIIQSCPNRNDVTIRLDLCLLRYSSRRFFSEVDSGVPTIYRNQQDVSDPAVFNRELGELMYNLSYMAVFKPSKFEFTSIRYSDFSNIFGMVQCTQDLSSTSCFKCLHFMIDFIPSCCIGSRGGRIIGKSCYVRFADLPYFVFSPPPPTVQGDAGKGDDAGRSKESSTNIVVIVVPIIIGALLLLAVSVCVYFSTRKRWKTTKSGGEWIESAESLQFDLGTIRIATKDFSDANKLGEGGFGAVYKGELLDGKGIAVKRLSRNFGQSSQEFEKNVALLHNLQSCYLR